MRHILSLSIVLAIAPPGIAAAEGMDTFDGTERLVLATVAGPIAAGSRVA